MDERNYIFFKSKLSLSSKLLIATEFDIEKISVNKKAFNLHSYSDNHCKFYFRFTKQEIERLCAAFKLPSIIRTDDKSKFEDTEALCIRLSYPNRLGDLQLMFSRTRSQLSRIINWMLRHIDSNYGFLLKSVDLSWLNPDSLQEFAAQITLKGSPLTKCVGFIDGTLRPFCRPTYHQKALYNGHKRVHGIKFQSVVTPNGIISNLYAPVEGRRHDAYMLRISELLPKMQTKLRLSTVSYCLYGDPAYPIRPELIAPFKGSNLSPEQSNFNKSMSVVRQSVEWEFGRVLQQFAFLDFKKNLKLYLQPVGLYYRVGVILGNCHACLHPSITSTYFNVQPPLLEHYLKNSQNDD